MKKVAWGIARGDCRIRKGLVKADGARPERSDEGRIGLAAVVACPGKGRARSAEAAGAAVGCDAVSGDTLLRAWGRCAASAAGRLPRQRAKRGNTVL